MDTDILIAGAGPSGLSLGISLAQAGLQVTLLEQQPESALAEPAPDGREIALTHPSVATLERLGIWQHLHEHECGSIRQAVVHDGPVGWRPTLDIDPAGSGLDALGRIVPNHAIRRAAWRQAEATPGLEIITGAKVAQASIGQTQAQISYSQQDHDRTLSAPLLVAADSRFSALRRMLGVGAQMSDFGRSVIVCPMEHELPHHDIAHECFGWERTLAILPLPPDPDSGALRCSAVVTTGSDEAARLMAQSNEDFTAQVQAAFGQRLGAMAMVGQRHSYPLIATWAQRFAGHRFALLGDAAVGMHPVTAHGFNLGLAGVERLTAAITAAHSGGWDWGSATALQPYASGQQRHAWPIFQGTNAVVRLFTDARPLPRLLRQAVLQGARHLPPLQAAIAAQLTGRGMLQTIARRLLP